MTDDTPTIPTVFALPDRLVRQARRNIAARCRLLGWPDSDIHDVLQALGLAPYKERQ